MAIQRSRYEQRLVLTSVLSVFIISLFTLLSSCGSSSAGLPAVTGNAEVDMQTAKKIYSFRCSICHGDDGTMSYGGAKDLPSSTLTKEQVIEQITNGKGAMPAMKDVLDKEHIDILADYAMSLRH